MMTIVFSFYDMLTIYVTSFIEIPIIIIMLFKGLPGKSKINCFVQYNYQLLVK